MKHESSDRTIELGATIDTTLARAWWAWTTEEGLTSWWVSNAKLDLAIGGRFEIYFSMDAPEGSRGSEGCTILSYAPQKALSFTWNAPPSIPELRALGPCTWVVLDFEQVAANRTRIHLVQLGIKRGPAWDQYLAYFQKAWPRVLEGCRRHFAGD